MQILKKIKNTNLKIRPLKKAFLSFLFLSFYLISCTSDDPKYTFQISGNLKTFDATNIVLQGKDSTLLTAEKKGGKFFMNSPKELAIGQYYLKIDTISKRIPILIDNTNVKVFINPDDLSKSYTKGKSDYQKTFSKYQSAIKNSKDIYKYQKRFIEVNGNTALGAIALKDMLGKGKWRLEQTQKLYNKLSPLIQKSDIGIEIKDYITVGLAAVKQEVAVKEKTTKEAPVVTKVKATKPKKTATKTNPSPVITSYAPFFYAESINGGDLGAKSVFAKNKLTLIDFWASWCGPCRAQNPDLLRLYRKYHSKGFEILSVSEDKEMQHWKNAVAQDQMIWKHVIDDYKRIANMYHVRTIPYAVLVNSQGGIVQKRISPGRLESILRSEFGY